jgi:hypothetical protein
MKTIEYRSRRTSLIGQRFYLYAAKLPGDLWGFEKLGMSLARARSLLERAAAGSRSRGHGLRQRIIRPSPAKRGAFQSTFDLPVRRDGACPTG